MKDKLRRAGWLFLAALFIFTGLGVGVYAFWADTHQNQNNQNQTQAQTQPTNNSCAFSGSEPAAALPKPDVYQPNGKVDQLQATDLQKGSGPAAKSGDCLVVKYYGTLASNGTLFDEDYTKNTALQFPLGQGDVIPGWDQGLIGMQAGGERRLVIPSSLAYGSTGQGAIPPNSDLVFVVKLISVK